MRYRLTAVAIAVVCGAIALGPDWIPAWLRAACATHALVCLICARWWHPTIETTGAEQWTPAPPDPTILDVHREALNPVPAVARPPVDRLLEQVPPPSLTPLFVTEDGGTIPSVEVMPADRMLAVERAVLTVAGKLDEHGDRLDEQLNRFAETVAGAVADLDRRIAALEANRPVEPLEVAR